MRFLKGFLVSALALVIFIGLSPSLYAIDVVSQFNTPKIYQLTPNETKVILFNTPSGTNTTTIIAKIERVSASGKVTGDYFVYRASEEIKVGSLSGDTADQTAGISYFQPEFSALLKLKAIDTTSPVTIKVTFYNGVITP